MTIHVVTFHTTKSTWSEQPHPLNGFKRPHTEFVDLFLASLRTHEPDATITLLTDMDSDVPGSYDWVIRRDFPQAELTLARFKMQRDFLALLGERLERVVMLDTDILLNGRLGDVFDGGFDMGLTIRDQPMEPGEVEMPYNNGVIFVDCRRRLDGILAFYDEIIRRVQVMHTDLHSWLGTQYAVRDLVGRQTVGTTVEVGAIDFRILPCSTFNHTPRSADECVANRVVLHFKGQFKQLMTDYAETLKVAPV